MRFAFGLLLALVVAAPAAAQLPSGTEPSLSDPAATDPGEQRNLQRDIHRIVPDADADTLPRNPVLFVEGDERNLRATLFSTRGVRELDPQLLVEDCPGPCHSIIALAPEHTGRFDVVVSGPRQDRQLSYLVGADRDDAPPVLPGDVTAEVAFEAVRNEFGFVIGGTHSVALTFPPFTDDVQVGALGVWDTTERLATQPIRARLPSADQEPHSFVVRDLPADEDRRMCLLLRAWDIAGNLSTNTESVCVELTDELSGCSHVSGTGTGPVAVLALLGMVWRRRR